MAGRRAVFVDRDGVLNGMLWIGDEWDSPLRVEQVTLLPRAGEAVRLLNAAGLPVVVVSNQPVIAKGKTTAAELERITAAIRAGIGEAGGVLDAVYYCLHHPRAVVDELRGPCDCRKPAAGLLRTAARDLGLDPVRSYMVGDRPTDVQAGCQAGCTTILIETAWGDGTLPVVPLDAAQPDHVAADLHEAAAWIVAHAARAGGGAPSRETCGNRRT